MLGFVFRWRWAAVAAALVACGPTEQDRALDECRALHEAKDHEQARTRCAAVFVAYGQPEAASLSARSSFFSEHYDELGPWLERVEPGLPVAEVEYLLASVALRHDDLERALQHLREAEHQLRSVRAWAKAAKVSAKMAHTVWDAGRFEQAHAHLLAAVTHAEASGDPALMLEYRITLSEFFIDMGATRLARQWLSHARDGPPVDDARLQARLVFQEGLHARIDEQWDAAVVAYAQALESFEAAQQWYEARAAHMNLAQMHLRAGRVDAARAQVEQAATTLRRAEEQGYASGPNERCSIAHQRALVELAAGRPDAALALVDAVSGDAVPPDWGWRLAIVRGRAALAAGDRGKARAALREAVDAVEALRRRAGGLEFRHFTVERRREPYERLFALHVDDGDIVAALDIYERARARALVEAFVRNHRESVEAEQALAGLAGLRAMASRWSEPVASADATDPTPTLAGVSVLGHLVTRDETYELTFDGHGWEVRRLGLGRQALRRAVEDARPGIEPGWDHLRQRLAPLADRLPLGQPVVIMAEPILERVPWAALAIDGVPMVERHALSVMPSLATALVWSAMPPSTRGGGLVVADARGDLPAARASAERLSAGLGLPVVVGSAASRPALSERVVDLWHLSVHAGTDPRGAWVELADGRLYADEIGAWSDAPTHVVLAGCRSAIDDDPGVWGALPAAFLAAGSRRVVATLRPVTDDDAAAVVAQFYAEGGQHDPIGALARAQRTLRARGWAPARWSPYIAIGMPAKDRNPSALTPTENR
ncbi:MAG: CHAT domain-containing protein [Deltaproteobacteria bacterium]|nr:CHAT domain-containing protein [Deltaproteobacteria bacterium]